MSGCVTRQSKKVQKVPQNKKLKILIKSYRNNVYFLTRGDVKRQKKDDAARIYPNEHRYRFTLNIY